MEVDEEDLAMDEEDEELAELEEELEEAEAADVRRFERAEAKRQRNAVPICQRCHGLRHRRRAARRRARRPARPDDALTRARPSRHSRSLGDRGVGSCVSCCSDVDRTASRAPRWR